MTVSACAGMSSLSDPVSGADTEQPSKPSSPSSIPDPQDINPIKDSNIHLMPAMPSFCPPGNFPAMAFLPNAKPIALGQPAPFLEGPVWMANEQFLLFTGWSPTDVSANGLNSILFRWDPKTNQIDTWQPAGAFRANGLAVTLAGDLVLADHGVQGVQQMKGTDRNQIRLLANRFNNKPFNSPNDVAVARTGDVYMTDPDYQKLNREGQNTTAVYRIDGQGNVHVIDDSLIQPNGLTLSLDETILYVGGADGWIWTFKLDAMGQVVEKKQWINVNTGIDGLTHDCAGNIVVTLPSRLMLVVLSPVGQELARFSFTEGVTNVAYGGVDRKTLYVTTAGRLWQIPSEIPGWPY